MSLSASKHNDQQRASWPCYRFWFDSVSTFMYNLYREAVGEKKACKNVVVQCREVCGHKVFHDDATWVSWLITALCDTKNKIIVASSWHTFLTFDLSTAIYSLGAIQGIHVMLKWMIYGEVIESFVSLLITFSQYTLNILIQTGWRSCKSIFLSIYRGI